MGRNRGPHLTRKKKDEVLMMQRTGGWGGGVMSHGELAKIRGLGKNKTNGKGGFGDVRVSFPTTADKSRIGYFAGHLRQRVDGGGGVFVGLFLSTCFSGSLSILHRWPSCARVVSHRRRIKSGASSDLVHGKVLFVPRLSEVNHCV